MSDWPTRTLEELCVRVTVGHVGSMAREYVESGVPFLRSQNIKRGRLDLSSVKYINEDFHQRLVKSQLQPGDLAIVRTGEPGATALIPDDLGPANCSDIVIARPGPDTVGRYLCYAINATAQQFIDAHTVGAVQQHFNVASAKRLTVAVPPIAVQEAIASLLGALDDKIAVNDRIAATAEKLCLAQFSDQTGAAMTPVGELCQIERKQIDPRELSNNSVLHFSIPSFDAGCMPEVADPREIKSLKFEVPPSAILVSKLNPGTPRVWHVRHDGEVPAMASTEFLILLPIEGVSTAELWAVLSQPAFMTSIAAKVTGTSNSHQRVKPAEIMGAEIADPRQFGQLRLMADALLQRVLAARQEARTLRALRDTLLPELMSGRLRVRDAEKVVEEAV